jgi:hypothetical protein
MLTIGGTFPGLSQNFSDVAGKAHRALRQILPAHSGYRRRLDDMFASFSSPYGAGSDDPVSKALKECGWDPDTLSLKLMGVILQDAPTSMSDPNAMQNMSKEDQVKLTNDIMAALGPEGERKCGSTDLTRFDKVMQAAATCAGFDTLASTLVAKYGKDYKLDQDFLDSLTTDCSNLDEMEACTDRVFASPLGDVLRFLYKNVGLISQCYSDLKDNLPDCYIQFSDLASVLNDGPIAADIMPEGLEDLKDMRLSLGVLKTETCLVGKFHESLALGCQYEHEQTANCLPGVISKDKCASIQDGDCDVVGLPVLLTQGRFPDICYESSTVYPKGEKDGLGMYQVYAEICHPDDILKDEPTGVAGSTKPSSATVLASKAKAAPKAATGSSRHSAPLILIGIAAVALVAALAIRKRGSSTDAARPARQAFEMVGSDDATSLDYRDDLQGGQAMAPAKQSLV